MRVLVAFDKFKDSLAAARACKLAVRALRSEQPGWQFDSCPLTDGGEGFAEILTRAAHGRLMTFPVSGPRGGLIAAGIGLVLPSQIPAPARSLFCNPETGAAGTRPIGIIETAAASGLSLLPVEQRDPWQTTTHGVGQLIRAAAELGCAGILLGVGDSATMDVGLGALSAIGYEFRAADGSKIRPPAPTYCDRIVRIEGEAFSSIPPLCIACDVTNPLLGPTGAAAVYGPQKGLRREDGPRMEAAVARLARLLCDCCGKPWNLAETPGAGAAGGLPFGLMAGANARLVPGFDLVSAWLGMEARIAAADIVITGEGSFDASSLSGKGPGAVAARALAFGKVVHVFAGRLGERLPLNAWQLHAITPPGCPGGDMLHKAPEFLVRSIQAAFQSDSGSTPRRFPAE